MVGYFWCALASDLSTPCSWKANVLYGHTRAQPSISVRMIQRLRFLVPLPLSVKRIKRVGQSFYGLQATMYWWLTKTKRVLRGGRVVILRSCPV